MAGGFRLLSPSRPERRDHLARRPRQAKGDQGRSLAGDIDAQTRRTFRNIEKTLAMVGAGLEHIVTLTVFPLDARNTRRGADIRKEILKRDFPASVALTMVGFGDPDMMIEIQAHAAAPAV